MKFKKCIVCGDEKGYLPIEEFYKMDPGRYRTTCRACYNKKRMDDRAVNRAPVMPESVITPESKLFTQIATRPFCKAF